MSLLAGGVTPVPNGAIIQYFRPPPTFGMVSDETHFVRDGIERIDQRFVTARTRTALLRRSYTRPGQPFRYETISTTDGHLVGVFAMDDPLNAPPAASLRHWTGPVETHLGEHCRVWEAVRLMEIGSSFIQSGCTTSDGFELWRKQASIDAITATRVRRTEVPSEAVRLPIEALDTAALLTAGANTDHRNDYAVLLHGPSGETELYRRSGDWRYVAVNGQGAASIDIRNVATGVSISYSRDANGTRRLGWSRPPYADHVREKGMPGAPLAKASTRTVLNEQCTMRDLMAGAMDAGRQDCLTKNGIPLLSNRQSWGSERTLTAMRLSRSPQPLAEFTLPAALTQPDAWPVQ